MKRIRLFLLREKGRPDKEKTMFKKTIVPKNRAAKVSALLTFIGGAFAFIMASGGAIPYPVVAQFIGIVFFTYAIFVVSAYLTRRYTFIVESVSGAAEDGEGAYDLIVYEVGAKIKGAVGTVDKKICHVSVKHIEFIRVVDAENKKAVAKERRKMDRYTYDAQFMAARRIEIVIKNGGEEASMLITYDEELLRALLATGVRKI